MKAIFSGVDKYVQFSNKVQFFFYLKHLNLTSCSSNSFTVFFFFFLNNNLEFDSFFAPVVLWERSGCTLQNLNRCCVSTRYFCLFHKYCISYSFGVIFLHIIYEGNKHLLNKIDI